MQNKNRLAAVLILCGAFVLAQDRRRPPVTVGCDRNELTSYTGVIKKWSRGGTKVRLVVQTDAKTVETFSVPVKSIVGQNLRIGDRVTVWLCKSGAVTIEWERTPLPR